MKNKLIFSLLLIAAGVCVELGVMVLWALVVIISGVALRNPKLEHEFVVATAQWWGVFFGSTLSIIAGWLIGRKHKDAYLAGLLVGISCFVINASTLGIFGGNLTGIRLLGLGLLIIGGFAGGWIAEKRKTVSTRLTASENT